VTRTSGNNESPNVRFLPGKGTAVVGRRLYALVEEPPNGRIVGLLSSLIESDRVDQLAMIRSVFDGGFDAVESFGIVVIGEECTRIVIRGSVVAEVLDAGTDSMRRIDAAGLIVAHEQIVPAEASIRLLLSGVESQEFGKSPYLAARGVLPSSAIQIGLFSVPVPDLPQAGQESHERSSLVVPIEQPTTVLDEPPEPVASLLEPQPHEDERLQPGSADAGDETVVVAEDGFEGSVAAAEGFATVNDDANRIPETDAGVYDGLFGATQIRSVEQAAVRIEVSEPGTSHSDALEESREAMDQAGAQVTTSSGDDVDHDGSTISLEELRALRSSDTPIISTGSVPGSGGGPVVLSTMCPIGHANPTQLSNCRVCNAGIAPQEPKRVPRPPLGVLVFSTGERVTLAGNIVVGRSPRAVGPMADGRLPEHVRLESPNHDISRTHLEVRVDEWQVTVVDLQSANGTTVIVPGRPIQQLRPHEPVIINPGTTVQLAGEIEFVMETYR